MKNVWTRSDSIREELKNSVDVEQLSKFLSRVARGYSLEVILEGGKYLSKFYRGDQTPCKGSPTFKAASLKELAKEIIQYYRPTMVQGTEKILREDVEILDLGSEVVLSIKGKCYTLPHPDAYEVGNTLISKWCSRDMKRARPLIRSILGER